MPVLGEVEVNPIATNIALMFRGGNYIHQDLFPSIPMVAESAGRFLDVDTTQEAQRLDQLERPTTGRPVRFDFNMADTKTYRTIDRTLEFLLDDKVRKAYRNVVDLEAAAGRIGMDKLLLVRENLVSTPITAAANYGTDNKKTLSGTGQWSDYNNSTPLEDIEVAREAIALSCGLEPNTFWMGRRVWTKISAHPDIVGLLGANAPKVMRPELLAQLLGFDKVLVGGKIYVTAKRGQTVTRDFLWGKFAGLAYVNSNPSLFEPSFGYRVPWEEVQVGMYRDEPHKSDVWRIGEDCDYKFLQGECGYLWTTAVA